MKNILLQVTTEVIVQESLANTDSTSLTIWFWIALVELAIIALLILKIKKKQEGLKFGDLTKEKMRNAKNSEVDMDNLMNSINGSKDLYKELSRNCHPDRFIGSDKQKLAEEIFQEISKHRRDFQKLTVLKEKAVTELNINLK